MYADIIIKNAKCITVNNKKVFEWLAIKDEKIIAIDNGEKYNSLINKTTIILDAKGKSVLPGFIDSHFHLVQTAMNEEGVNLHNVSSFEEIGEKIKKANLKSKETIFRVRLEKENLQEKKFPDRKVLDKFSDDTPIWINNLDYQVSILNTYGLLYYKIPFRIDGIELDEKGAPTGIFRGKANATLRTNILNSYSNKNREENIRKLIPKLLEVGITTVNAMEGGYMYSDKDANFIYEHIADCPIDIV